MVKRSKGNSFIRIQSFLKAHVRIYARLTKFVNGQEAHLRRICQNMAKDAFTHKLTNCCLAHRS